MDHRFGYTTGTFATAAAKGAIIGLSSDKPRLQNVEIDLPRGEKALIKIDSLEKRENSALCWVTKKSVEETDVTHNMVITAQVDFRKDNQIVIDGGKGIGRITKKGLQLPIGEAAINPVPRKMITDSLRQITDRGVNVLICAPKGEEIAKETYNSRLGIVGGISIIGTTGIMKPKSLAAFKDTILQQLQFCKENRFDPVVISPGNISEKAMLSHYGDQITIDQIVQSGDYLGFTLKKARKLGLNFLLAGHPGKLAKTLGGHFQTHFKQSPRANEYVVELFQDKLSPETLKEIKESPTVEGIISILKEKGETYLLDKLAIAIEDAISNFLETDDSIPVILFDMQGEKSGISRSWNL